MAFYREKALFYAAYASRFSLYKQVWAHYMTEEISYICRLQIVLHTW